MQLVVFGDERHTFSTEFQSSQRGIDQKQWLPGGCKRNRRMRLCPELADFAERSEGAPVQHFDSHPNDF